MIKVTQVVHTKNCQIETTFNRNFYFKSVRAVWTFCRSTRTIVCSFIKYSWSEFIRYVYFHSICVILTCLFKENVICTFVTNLTEKLIKEYTILWRWYRMFIVYWPTYILEYWIRLIGNTLDVLQLDGMYLHNKLSEFHISFTW